ncbi:MAG: putative metal-dependent hydrolase [Ignavibacteriae bacterium]|nr:putative metal-dependent hydrolase [Ignavibacteriota bacterium]MCB9209528.1 putative metal-dependent hydrolase [Ignavibacteriales bacterium]MCB9258171.1 putative metal-dependent hydrolase [Ignavibacteriales bacterium]
MDIEKLKYPIGKFQKPVEFTDEKISEFINVLETLPRNIKLQVTNLTEDQLDTQYRPNGWTIRQVVNHIADSHMNSLIRFKLALTEKNPTIKPYFEDRWAELIDSKNIPINSAVKMIEGIHERWVVLLKSFTQNDWERTFYHPESKREISLKENLAIYAWHSLHHLAHITELKKRNSW